MLLHHRVQRQVRNCQRQLCFGVRNGNCKYGTLFNYAQCRWYHYLALGSAVCSLWEPGPPWLRTAPISRTPASLLGTQQRLHRASLSKNAAMVGLNSIHYHVYISTAIVICQLYFSDVCFLRLDFETFTTQGPAVTTEIAGGACPDTFAITVINYLICNREFSLSTKDFVSSSLRTAES